MTNEPGDSATYPANIRLPASGDPRTATIVGAQGHDLADRTAWLRVRTGDATASTAGSSASYPANITVPTASGAPSTGAGQGIFSLADRTAYLKAAVDTNAGEIATNAGAIASTQSNVDAVETRVDTLEDTRMTTDISVFTSSGTWTKPANAKSTGFIKIVCVGGGDRGSDGGVGTGGAGGEAGEIVEVTYRTSHLPATMSVTIGRGGGIALAPRPSYIIADGATIVFAQEGGSSDIPYPSDVNAQTYNGAAGGAGGAATSGTAGKHSRKAPGGAGGATNVAGSGGLGYGAGGGGGRQSSGSNSGGGGGGGGFFAGSGVGATAGSGSSGGAGAVGYVHIMTQIEGL